MLTPRRRDADVQIIFISDEDRCAPNLAKKLDELSYRIHFSSYSSSPSNMIAIWDSVSLARPFLPTAIFIDYFCNGGRCEDMLRDLGRMVEKAGVEVIILNAPDGHDTHDALLALGADTIVRAEAPSDRHIVAH